MNTVMDLTKPSTVHLAELLCHCPGVTASDGGGHPLDVPGCTATIRPGRYDRPDVGCLPNPSVPVGAAAPATCPGCGTPRTARRVQRRGHAPHITGLGVPLGYAAVVAPHRHRGATCPGGPPAELRVTEAPDVAWWAAEHGPGSVR